VLISPAAVGLFQIARSATIHIIITPPPPQRTTTTAVTTAKTTAATAAKTTAATTHYCLHYYNRFYPSCCFGCISSDSKSLDSWRVPSAIRTATPLTPLITSKVCEYMIVLAIAWQRTLVMHTLCHLMWPWRSDRPHSSTQSLGCLSFRSMHLCSPC
jgi:hypothetical protein